MQTPGQAPASGAPESLVNSPAVAQPGSLTLSNPTLSQPNTVSRPEDDPLRMAGGSAQQVGLAPHRLPPFTRVLTRPVQPTAGASGLQCGSHHGIASVLDTYALEGFDRTVRTDRGWCIAVLAPAHAQAGGPSRVSCTPGGSRCSSCGSSCSCPSAAGRPALAALPAAAASPHQSSGLLCAAGKPLPCPSPAQSVSYGMHLVYCGAGTPQAAGVVQQPGGAMSHLEAPEALHALSDSGVAS